MKLSPQASPKDFPLPLKAVLFDLDGTLLDTAPDLVDATNRTLSELGMAAVDAEIIRSYIGGGIAVLLQRALAATLKREPDMEIYQRGLPLFEKHYARVMLNQSRPFPGAVEGLQKMRAQGLHLACVTNKSERFTLPLLEATDLRDFFELVVSGDSVPKKKPDPLPLTHACAHFGAKPHEALLIGDSPLDTQAARAAGCHVFCVPYGYHQGRDVRELDCDAIVATLKDAADLVIKA
ncbi:MAG TPA: phosphoglycolate phosphatase [Burkholderiales bacterium]|nr:phosphoglycolate phosphatase [Burkholderiales bacterium]